jgi:hypothetical protein
MSASILLITVFKEQFIGTIIPARSGRQCRNEGPQLILPALSNVTAQDEAGRNAANVAKLPELPRRSAIEDFDRSVTPVTDRGYGYCDARVGASYE